MSDDDQNAASQDYTAKIEQLKTYAQATNDLIMQAVAQLNPQLGNQLELEMQKLMREMQVIQVESKKFADQFSRMQEAVRTFSLMTSSLELDEVLQEVMDTIIKLTGAERAYLMLSEEDGELAIRVARNWDQESLSTTDATFSSSIVKSVMMSKEPILTMNAVDDERFQNAASITGQVLRSILCIPPSAPQ